MATPNLTSSTLTIIPNITTVAITTTAKVGILTNPSSSNKVYKVNVVRASNISGAQVDVSMGMTGPTGAGTTFYLLRNCVVPPQTSLLIISKDSYQYLTEGSSFHIEASSAGTLHILASWEEIS